VVGDLLARRDRRQDGTRWHRLLLLLLLLVHNVVRVYGRGAASRTSRPHGRQMRPGHSAMQHHRHADNRLRTTPHTSLLLLTNLSIPLTPGILTLQILIMSTRVHPKIQRRLTVRKINLPCDEYFVETSVSSEIGAQQPFVFCIGYAKQVDVDKHRGRSC